MKKLSTGIYRDGSSIRAIVDIAAGRKEKRFDPDHPLKDIKRWRNEMKVKLEALHPQKRAGAIGRGTFSADAKKYLKTLAIASWKSRRSELRAWEARFGKVARRRVTADHVRAAIKHWSDAEPPVPAKTIVNRVRALTAMYHALDGADAWTPADGVAVPKPPKRNPDYVSPLQLIAVEQRLRELEQAEADLKVDPAWRGRYMVMAATGQRPVFVKRAKAPDVDLARKEWSINAAKGGNAIVLPLNADMIAAWEVFIAANAWGDFDATEYAKVVRAAGWPEGRRPYATKHSLSQDMAERGVDLETIADWHGHTGGFATTRIYTGFAKAKLRMASVAIEGRLQWGNTTTGNLGGLTEQDRKARIDKLLAEIGELAQMGS